MGGPLVALHGIVPMPTIIPCSASMASDTSRKPLDLDSSAVGEAFQVEVEDDVLERTPLRQRERRPVVQCARKSGASVLGSSIVAECTSAFVTFTVDCR